MSFPGKKIDEPDFIREFEAIGPAELARKYKMQLAGVYKRRVRIEKRIGRQLKIPKVHEQFSTRHAEPIPGRLQFPIDDGVVIVFSDAHYWPSIVTTAHRALLHFAREMQPKAIIANGDVFDGAKASRHPPIGWEHRPEITDELEAVKARLLEIERAAPNAKRFWPLGNHDARFETRLAIVAPEYAKIHGFSLKDHMPYWHPCWSVFVNDDTVVKHRFKGGIHATHNNALWAGRTMVTGHLHSLRVTPLADYNGNRWGVDTGTLADPFGMQFNDYMEDGPRNWRSGFAVLTFWRGRLLWPELVHVIGPDQVEFRGQVIEVGDGKKKARRRT